MKSGYHRKIEFALLGIALVLFSLFTAMRYSPQYAQADILLNSVMSLQNLTLFYWGQNRLLNVLPFLAAIFMDPVWNLRFVLFFPALCHFSLLLLGAKVAVEMAEDTGQRYVLLKVFVTLSAVFLLLFKEGSIFEIAIGHIEYSLSVLLAGYGFFTAARKQFGFYVWLGLTVTLVAIATGLNFSVILFSLFLGLAHWLYFRKIGQRVLVFCMISLVAFVVWNYISRQYGEMTYSGFSLAQLRPGLALVLTNLLGSMDTLNLLFVMLVLFALNFFRHWSGFRESDSSSHIYAYALTATGLFGIGWLLLFSASTWVAINDFSYRYFTFVLYGMLLFVAFEIRRALDFVRICIGWGAFGVSAILASSMLWSGLLPFAEYQIFKKVNSLAHNQLGLYSGDYWLVWPSVLRDLLDGGGAYGLAHRAEANREKVKQFASGYLAKNGFVAVSCLGEGASGCVRKISDVIGPVHLEEAFLEKEGVIQLKLSRMASRLVYHGGDFAALPSNAGEVKNSTRVTNGTSGCLFFGPYVPMKSGTYQLSVYGNSRNIHAAVVDVVAKHGTVVLARFSVPAMKSSMLLRNETMHVPDGILDLEVRLCLSGQDDLEATGYELLPDGN